MKNEKEPMTLSDHIPPMPNFIQSILHKKVQSGFSSIFKKTVPRIFIFNLSQATFGYKSTENSPMKKSYKKTELTGFVTNVDKNDELIKKTFKYGFKIFTKDRIYTLYTDDRDDYDNWIRLLNFHFYRNDNFIGRRIIKEENVENKKENSNIDKIEEKIEEKKEDKINEKINEKFEDENIKNQNIYEEEIPNEYEPEPEHDFSNHEEETNSIPEIKEETKFQIENLHFKNIITKAIDKVNNEEGDKNNTLILDNSKILNPNNLSKSNAPQDDNRILLIKYVRDDYFENKNLNNKISNITKNILKNTNYEYGLGEFYHVQAIINQSDQNNQYIEKDSKYYAADVKVENIITEEKKNKDSDILKNENYKDYENIMIKPIDLLNGNQIESKNTQKIDLDNQEISINDINNNEVSSPITINENQDQIPEAKKEENIEIKNDINDNQVIPDKKKKKEILDDDFYKWPVDD
jgi:hypothetical protein